MPGNTLKLSGKNRGILFCLSCGNPVGERFLRYRDFSEDGGRSHIDFVLAYFDPPLTKSTCGSITLHNLVVIDAVILIMRVLIFGMYD